MKTLLISLISFLFVFNYTDSYSQYTDAEKSGLLFTLQEEKAANNFYTEMYNKYNLKVFENIMNAEKMHMEHVLNLLNDLNIEATGYTQNAGEFSFKDVQDIYDELMKTGGYSSTDALLASARYEEKDISDLRNFNSKANNESIKTLYGCLDKASQNHLRAFVRNLKRDGINYSPRILSTEEFNEIINSKNQPGDCFQNK